MTNEAYQSSYKQASLFSQFANKLNDEHRFITGRDFTDKMFQLMLETHRNKFSENLPESFFTPAVKEMLAYVFSNSYGAQFCELKDGKIIINKEKLAA